MGNNNDPTVRKLAICVFKDRKQAKANLFWDKSAGRRHGFFGIGATQPTVIFNGWSVGWRQNFRLRVEAREAEDGSRLLGFYTSEAEEEIRGVGFENHQLTGNLWRHVGRQPPRMATRVSEKWISNSWVLQIAGQEEICNVGFAKGWRKTNRSEGRLELKVWRLWLLLLCLHSSLVNSGERDKEEKKREKEKEK